MKENYYLMKVQSYVNFPGLYFKKATSHCLCFIILACMLAGCAQEPEDIKTVISILYFNECGNLEKLVEDTYSDIDLQFERLSYPSEQMRRLEKGMGPELVVFTRPSDEISEKYLLDISDTQASTAYDGTVMQQLQVDGITYFLPLPGQYSGYIVNETFFRKAGIPLPISNQELLEAVGKMKELGIGVGEDGINFSISSATNAELGTYYAGYMVPDFLGTVDGVDWLAAFRRKEATFTGTWESMLTLTDQMVEAGLLDTAAMGRKRNLIRDAQRMADGTLAVSFGNSSLYQECRELNQTYVQDGIAPEYSYRMLPLLSDEGNENWLLLAPSAYVAVNAAVNEEKQEAAKRVLELISTSEGQEAVMKDLQMGVSYLHNYQPDTAFIPEGLEEYIQSGYIYNIQFPDRVIEYLGSQVRQTLVGKMTLQEALEAVDRYYYEGSETVDYDLSVIGTVGHDMLLQNYNVRLGETEIGNLLADSVAEASGAPIAVVNGGGIRSSLYQGEVYGEELSAVCPYDNVVIILEMKGKTLWEMMENSLTTITDDLPGGRFLHVSGFSYIFDSRKPAGQRVSEIRLADGTELDQNSTYQVAVNDYMAGRQGYAEGNGDGYKMLNCYDGQTTRGNVNLILETNMTYRDALAQYFENHRDTMIDKKTTGRITDLAKKGY